MIMPFRKTEDFPNGIFLYVEHCMNFLLKKKKNVTNGSKVFLFFIFDVLKNSYLGGE